MALNADRQGARPELLDVNREYARLNVHNFTRIPLNKYRLNAFSDNLPRIRSLKVHSERKEVERISVVAFLAD
jgi:hypothetical protein